MPKSKRTAADEDRWRELMDRPVENYSDYMGLLQDVRRRLPTTYASKAESVYGLGRDASSKDFKISAKELALPVSLRPVVWHDLIDYKSTFSRTNSDVVTDFGFAAPINFLPNIDVTGKGLTAMSRSHDILFRMYTSNPGPVSWARPTFAETFEKLYGGVIDTFHESQVRRDIARRALQMRFGAMFGISTSTAYRWFERTYKPTNHQTVLQKKITEQASPLARLEVIAMLVASLRGVDLDESAPAPTTKNFNQLPAPRDGRIGRMARLQTGQGSGNLSETYVGGSFG